MPKYHRTDKSKHSDRLCVLNKIENEYNYDNMNFPVSYDDIEETIKYALWFILLL